MGGSWPAGGMGPRIMTGRNVFRACVQAALESATLSRPGRPGRGGELWLMPCNREQVDDHNHYDAIISCFGVVLEEQCCLPMGSGLVVCIVITVLLMLLLVLPASKKVLTQQQYMGMRFKK